MTLLALLSLWCPGWAANEEWLELTLDPTVEPQALPYRFTVDLRRHPTDENSRPFSESHVPLDIFGSGHSDLYHVGNDWTVHDTSTCLVFYHGPTPVEAFRHVNCNTLKLHGHTPDDFDGDDTLEVAVVYERHDSLFFALADPDKGKYGRLLLATGEDRNNNGVWDVTGYILTTGDVNGDGHPEVLVAIETGYDLYPRQLVCVNPADSCILWTYDIAGQVNYRSGHILADSISEERCVAVGLTPKRNGAIANSMDDYHSYLTVLNADGSRRWLRETGGEQSRTLCLTSDLDRDGRPEIIAAVSDSCSASLLVIRPDGMVTDSQSLGTDAMPRSFITTDLNGDGKSDVLVSFSDATLAVYDNQLQLVKRSHLPSFSSIIDCRDFLGIGSSQLLIGTDDDRTWLLDYNLGPLAVFDDQLEHHLTSVYSTEDRSGRLSIIGGADAGLVTYYLSLEKTPWFTVFFRKPWLASFAAAAPLVVIICVILLFYFRIRYKNRVITAAREELVAMQGKLVAAEKYAQAKDIAGGFAHEIRNALFPATSWLTLLRRAACDSDRMSEQVSEVNKSVRRAIDLTRVIKTYAGLDAAMEPEEVICSHCLNEVLEANRLRIEQMSVDIQIIGQTDTVIEINQKQLYTVLSNLLLNSLDALTARDSGRMFRVSCEHTSNNLIVTVTDNGSGIAPENLSRVFDTFFSTKPSTGTGLGLAMSKKIVEMYGGAMEIASEPGEGTAVTVTLRTSDRPTQATGNTL